MLAETYETPEVDEHGTPECEAEAVELIEQLGLEGQLSLINPDVNGDAKRIPYPKMTKEQKVVIQAVCPKESNLNEYKDQSIPLRILQVAAHAKELFEYLLVWHPENADEKDPYLIGRNGNGYSSTEYYILARWGEQLLPWGEMVEKAASMLRGKRVQKLNRMKSAIQADIESTETASPEAVIGMDHSPAYYSHSF